MGSRTLINLTLLSFFYFQPSPRKLKKQFRDNATQTESAPVISIETQTDMAPSTPHIKHINMDHSYMTSTPINNFADNHSINLSDIPTNSCIKQLYIPSIKETSVCLSKNGLEDEISDESISVSSSSASVDSSLGYSNDNEKTDPSYLPSASSSSSDDSSIDGDSISDKSFIVYGSALQNLFGVISCNTCGLKAIPSDTFVKGTLLGVNFVCEGGHNFLWKSQPESKNIPIGNIIMCASILFSGGSYTNINTISSYMNLQFIGRATYHRIQNNILFGNIDKAWRDHQQQLFNDIGNRHVSLAGDGRCDSPGYCAKYGTYTMMDINTNKIVDFYIAQSSETANSGAMEKHGLKKCLDNLSQSEITVETLVTDRHVQIRKFMRIEHPEIDHQFDVWHVAKSIGKKIMKKAKVKGCEELGRWRRSIVNHLWWACKTCDGDKDVLLEKWTSIIHHSANYHVFPGQHVTECGHDHLAKETVREIAWMKVDSPAHNALKDIVNNNILRKDIKQLNKFHHTGELESYHALMLKYIPKRIHYSMEGMNARTKLAVMDHNHNVNRAQAKIKKGKRKGELRYKVECPKMSKEWVAKKVYEQKSYAHVHELVKSVIETATNETVPRREKTRKLPRNISVTAKPQKSELIRKRVSRYSDE